MVKSAVTLMWIIIFLCSLLMIKIIICNILDFLMTLSKHKTVIFSRKSVQMYYAVLESVLKSANVKIKEKSLQPVLTIALFSGLLE